MECGQSSKELIGLPVQASRDVFEVVVLKSVSIMFSARPIVRFRFDIFRRDEQNFL